jgi:sensor histidine kinase YesM
MTKSVLSTIQDYEILEDVEQIMDKTGLRGAIAIHNKTTDNTLVKTRQMDLGAQETDTLVSQIRINVSGNEDADEYVYERVNGHGFLVRNYTYSSYDIVFLFEAKENIMDALSDFKEEHVILLPEDLTEAEPLSGDPITWQFSHFDYWVYVETDPMEAISKIPVFQWLVLLIVVLFPVFSVLIWRVLDMELMQPLRKLREGMQQVGAGDYDYRINDHNRRNSDEILYIMNSFDEMAQEIGDSRQKDIALVRAELDNLRLQVNPHMLLNSYNMIYSMAQSRNYDGIQEYTLLLVDYFRYVLRTNEDMVPLKQELEFTQNYIDIQKMRFPNAFSSVYRIDPECKEALVPPLLLENFVENAMKYAMIPGQTIEVIINIRQEQQRLLMSVIDSGRGMKEEVLQALKAGEPYIDPEGKKHIGVWNCSRRIRLFYGEEGNIHFSSVPGEGTQVFIDVPFVEQQSEDKGK